MGRSIFLILLILVILISVNPQVQTKLLTAWEDIRPAVVESMASLYAVVRNFVAGTDSDHHIHENPITPSPNFEIIIT